ncbi:hypothetical protein GGTG_00687 [Gaeumannomyces tritici R3-111a-1]|uniref:Uncharacterized protein n=1 Tax=Gaeumannomyces tritici (strain R3-111a-1) TaxID=644352 RepID=J3NHF0_GAET3|nr:hypothetical protein GGTG_00687 [Gaeumannomyces tritici R3-111a-1]EJT80693.1 hypothetical protein GGTG_00687 [Gaeumannomyces tritici R3-111a-1]
MNGFVEEQARQERQGKEAGGGSIPGQDPPVKCLWSRLTNKELVGRRSQSPGANATLRVQKQHPEAARARGQGGRHHGG